MIDTTTKLKLNEPDQEEALHTLFILTHDELDNPARFVDNQPNEPVTSAGQFYQPYRVEIIPPRMGEELPTSRLAIHNSSRMIGVVLRQIITPIGLEIRQVYADDIDNPFETITGLKIRDVVWNFDAIEAVIYDDDLSQEPLPWIRCTEDKFQAIHRRP